MIAADEQHLAVFHDLASAGDLHRLLPGDLPLTKPARKRLKADLETLFLLPAMGRSRGQALVALGSGSRPNRNTGVLIPLSADGAPMHAAQPFDLQPWYEPLRQALGEINIEGAMLLGGGFALLNRGVAGRSDNALARYPLAAGSSARRRKTRRAAMPTADAQGRCWAWWRQKAGAVAAA